MEMLTQEQAKLLTPEQLAARQAQKAEERAAFVAANKAQAMLAMRALERDPDGVPFVNIRADDVGAWQAVMFFSQRKRDAGDIEGRMKYGAVAHGFELGYWKEL